MRHLIFGLTLAAAMGQAAFGDKSGDAPDEESAVRKNVAAYVEAFNKHDAAALANMWSPEAVYINRITGEEVVGRDAIAEQFKALFKEQPELRLDVSPESIRFVSPNVAVEQGSAKSLAPKGDPEEFEYSAVYVKRDGHWLLDRVTDKPKEGVNTHHEKLKVLEWMIGNWVDKDDEVQIGTECNWAKNDSFLTRSFSVAAGDRIEMSGIQVIGWDPAANRIRSWTFDSDGGFAEGTWTKKGDKWFIHNKGYLSDGTTATMVNVIRSVNENTFTWQTVERTAGGELLPNIGEVVVVRE